MPTGKLVRRFASTDKPEAVDPKALAIDPDWIRPPQILSANAGSHRFVWDLHYPPPDGPRSYPISAVLATRRASRSAPPSCRAGTS